MIPTSRLTPHDIVASRFLAALAQRPDGMRREELEHVAGVRTRFARKTLYGLVACGAILTPEACRTGQGRAKLYLLGQNSQGTERDRVA
jgi:hypothetical protein